MAPHAAQPGADGTRRDAAAGRPLSLALVAGEPSGDMLAARLLSGLRPHLPDARFHGIGGPQMMAQGFESHWPMDQLTVRGLLPVLMRYRELKGVQSALRDQLLAERPAVFIGADYPGFNLGLEEQLKAAGIPTVHYIGPQIWAWRGGRIKKIIRAAYKLLYRTGLTLEEAKAALLEEEGRSPAAGGDIRAMRGFLDTATRGIVR